MNPNKLAQVFDQALALHREGQFDEAEKAYKKVLLAKPNHADALQLMGTIAIQTGRMQRGAELIGKSLALNPDQPSAQSNLGFALREVGRLEESLAACDKAVALSPGFVDAHNNRADTLTRLGRYAEALTASDTAIALNPDFANGHHSRANALNRLDRPADALAAYDRAMALGLDHAGIQRDRGQALLALKRLPEALASLDRALAMGATADAWSDRGSVLIDMKRPAEALQSYDAAIALQPGDGELFTNRSTALSALKRYDEALAACDRAVALQPDLAQAHVNRGNVLMILTRFGEAEAAFGQALALKPGHAGAAWNKSLLLLKTGRLEEGWRLHEARKLTDQPVGTGFEDHPLWLGEDRPGQTVLLHWEQGLGDTLQFCRYAKRVKAAGMTPLLLVQAPLKAVAKTLDPDIPVFAEGEALPAFDAHTPLISLPLAFGTTLDSIPAEPRYLSADPDRVEAWRSKLRATSKPRVGIAWSGNPAHANDHNRSVPLETLAPLLAADVDWTCLQKDLPDADREALGAIAWFGPQLGDFGDTAALIELMDLVITVDTSAAHLAGALGKPVWLLLPTSSDWRWMTDRTDTPWYPDMRLFRQRTAGDWAGVAADVRAALKDRLGA
jgi:tetratricopeptide (TPR) repeat protein